MRRPLRGCAPPDCRTSACSAQTELGASGDQIRCPESLIEGGVDVSEQVTRFMALSRVPQRRTQGVCCPQSQRRRFELGSRVERSAQSALMLVRASTSRQTRTGRPPARYALREFIDGRRVVAVERSAPAMHDLAHREHQGEPVLARKMHALASIFLRCFRLSGSISASAWSSRGTSSAARARPTGSSSGHEWGDTCPGTQTKIGSVT